MTELLKAIENFIPFNEQEQGDKELILKYTKENPDCLFRTNPLLHFTASAWITDKSTRNVLFVYHKIYDSWSWVGGHADGESDLKAVALREAEEETGIKTGEILSDDILSLEILTVEAHRKKGKYIAPHLHLNLTYHVIADINEELVLNTDETKGVKWFSLEAALNASTEKNMIEKVYKKLIAKTGN